MSAAARRHDNARGATQPTGAEYNTLGHNFDAVVAHPVKVA
jgi:hypothetical protein